MTHKVRDIRILAIIARTEIFIMRKKIIVLISSFVTMSLIPIYLYLSNFYNSNLSSDFKSWISFTQYISSTVGLIISFLAASISTWLIIEFNSFQKRQTTIQLFKEFRSQESRKKRRVASRVKRRWEKNKNNYQTLFIEAFISEKKNVSITKREIQSVYDLFAFYSMLSTYQTQSRIMPQLNYYYYAWWRKFLYEVAKKYDLEREKDINPLIAMNRGKKEVKAFLTNIKFTPKLEKLDKICGFRAFNDAEKPLNIYINN